MEGFYFFSSEVIVQLLLNTRVLAYSNFKKKPSKTKEKIPVISRIQTSLSVCI